MMCGAALVAAGCHMFDDYKLPACLSYGGHTTTPPCVFVDFALRNGLPVKVLAETVCIAIAQSQPENPLGLFRHPAGDTETGLHFKQASEQYQEQVTELAWFMYEACNNPGYVTVEIDGAEPLSGPLNDLVQAFHRPFGDGGLVDDDRADPVWGWDCMVSARTSAPVLSGYAEASDCGRLIFPFGGKDDAKLKAIRDVNIGWPVA